MNRIACVNIVLYWCFPFSVLFFISIYCSPFLLPRTYTVCCYEHIVCIDSAQFDSILYNLRYVLYLVYLLYSASIKYANPQIYEFAVCFWDAICKMADFIIPDLACQVYLHRGSKELTEGTNYAWTTEPMMIYFMEP